MNSFKQALENSTEEAKQFILGEKQGRIFNIILNRPGQSNAFTFGMYVRLHLLFDEAARDEQVDVVLVQARGKNFSAGNDLNNFKVADFSQPKVVHEFAEIQVDILKVLTSNLLNYIKPIICCCQGAVVGFIFPLLMIFDLVYITEDAYFAAPMIKMEQSLEMFASYNFPRLFGHGRGFELLVLGRRMTSNEAFQSKFAQQIFKTQDEMMKYALNVCQELTQMNSVCIKQAKILMKDQIRKSLWGSNLQELDNLGKVWKHPSFTQSLANYMQNIKMKPKL